MNSIVIIAIVALSFGFIVALILFLTTSNRDLKIAQRVEQLQSVRASWTSRSHRCRANCNSPSMIASSSQR